MLPRTQLSHQRMAAASRQIGPEVLVPRRRHNPVSGAGARRSAPALAAVFEQRLCPPAARLLVPVRQEWEYLLEELALYFLMYSEAANLRHTPEASGRGGARLGAGGTCQGCSGCMAVDRDALQRAHAG